MQRIRMLILVILLIQILAINVEAFDYYKSQLDTTKTEIYERIGKSVQSGENRADLTDIYDRGFYTKEELDVFVRKLGMDAQAAIDAFMKDHPEVFWLKFGEGGVGASYNIETIGSLNRITDVHFEIVIDEKYSDNLDEIDKSLWEKIEGFDVLGETRYEKARYIHDKLIEMIEYDGGFVHSHEAVGALVYGKAVCEGYAKAFKLICDRVGIPNVLVIGTGITPDGREEDHMWNYVQMEDGKWYAVDVTWDDQEEPYYDFFLVGGRTRDVNFGGKTFSESHIENGDFSGISAHVFVYPALEENAYSLESPEPESLETPKESIDITEKESNSSGNHIAMVAAISILGIVILLLNKRR